jgi:predicted N-acetyltransferase YhbS
MTDTLATAEVVADHHRRLASLDPLLPASPLIDPGPDDSLLTCPGGVGLAAVMRPDPDTMTATWGAAERHILRARVGGPDPVAAMAGLLDQWLSTVSVAIRTDDPQTEAIITWPSRDAALTKLFLSYGLAPLTVVAARLAGRPSPPGGDDVTVRALCEADIDAALQLWLEQVRWDAQFNTVRELPSTAAACRADLSAAAGAEQAWSWVAERDEQIRGLLMIQPPDQAGWIASQVSAAPAAYLGCLVVAARHRGSGIGAALVRRGHRALDAAGVAVTLLHYAGLNPLSGPFWHRCGYRPLWTAWQASPVPALAPKRMTEA